MTLFQLSSKPLGNSVGSRVNLCPESACNINW